MTSKLVKYVKTKDKILVNLIGLYAPVFVEVANYTQHDKYIEFDVVINYLDDFNEFRNATIMLPKNQIILCEKP